MVRFKNGNMIVNKSDYVSCPFCGVQVRDGKKFRVRMTLEGAAVMAECGEHQAMPLTIDLAEGAILAPRDRERTAYTGSAIVLHYLCENGCKVDRTVAMDKDGHAFSFDEQQNETDIDMEEELNNALGEEEEEDDDDEN